MVVMMTTEELDEGTEFFHEELFKDYPFLRDILLDKCEKR
jgi:hypothetical protein